MKIEKEITCKNCETTFEGNFCPNCSQSSHITRINLQYFLHDIPHSVLHVDKGLPYTFYQLSKNPGKTILAYLEGKRVKFFKPFAYVIILSTISSLLIKLTPKILNEEINNKLLSLFSHYPSILIFILIPFVALISWLIFIKKRFNYWEHFLMHTYLAAQINIILVLLHLLSLSSAFANTNMIFKLTVFNFIYMTYHGFTFSSLFTENYKNKFNVRLMMQISLCCLLLGFIYAFSLIFTRIAVRWF